MLSRLKFEINDLVNEMLDQIPDKYFKSNTTTFLDPSIAGGQFIKEICNRLTKAGHSWDNIQSRVFGLADTPLSLNYVMAKYENNITGQYKVGGIKELEEWKEMGKKFDVVIGNPPYQDPNRAGTSTKFWVKFVEMAFSISADNGYVSMITPASWMSPGSSVRELITTNETLYVNLDARKHFSGVGSQFAVFVTSKQAASKKTQIISNNKSFYVNIANAPFLPTPLTKEVWSITNKVLFGTHETLKTKVTYELHTDGKKDIISKNKSKKFKYPLFHSPTNELWSSIKPLNFNTNKVYFTKSGNLRPLLDMSGIGTSQDVFYTEITTKEEGTNLVKYLNSKLIQVLVAKWCKWSGFTVKGVVDRIPLIDLTRSWTDEELYKHFKLTKDEIKLIEDTVK